MKKKLLTLSLLLLFAALLASPANAQTTPQPVGIIALKATGIPAGTPEETQLGWTFNGFIANATNALPVCTLNVTQTLAAEANNTNVGGSISTPLSKTYDDDDYYIVPAAGTGPYEVDFSVNITLGNHYILNSSWITKLMLTAYGNVSILPDTKAHLYLYNFTSDEWCELGAYLNHTDEFPVNFAVSNFTNFLHFLDEDNTLMPRFYCNDSSYDFNVSIDYIAVTVTYNLDITVSDWTATQAEKTVGVSIAYEHTDTFTLATPSGIINHNFTLYYETPNYPLITHYGIEPKAKVSSQNVTVAPPITLNITNLVSNTTDITVTLPKVHIVKPPSDIVFTNVNFQGGIDKLAFTITGTGTKTIQIFIPSAPYTVIVDNHPLPTSNYTWTNGILNITVTLSTHTLEIYQYNPSPQLTPTPTPTPTPYETVTTVGAIPFWLIIIIITTALVMGYIILKKR